MDVKSVLIGLIAGCVLTLAGVQLHSYKQTPQNPNPPYQKQNQFDVVSPIK
ncbi:hypothetical protein [Dongshaea marina]|uniref:hypothetical protein n=1 Tax=Dongshaea marina TaxID=2047966 RepID=UPI00131F3FB1|nr:hypothetical protein [Dongshaea marina]